MKVSIKRGGLYLFVNYSRSHTFSRIVMLLSIFLTDKGFLFTYFDLIWCFIIGQSGLHFYMYIMPWHI